MLDAIWRHHKFLTYCLREGTHNLYIDTCIKQNTLRSSSVGRIVTATVTFYIFGLWI